MKLSIIIPIHNEELNIPILYKQLSDVLASVEHDYEIVVVNDGSTDQSGRVLTELGEKDTRVKVINLRRNFGQTAAMMACIDHASGDIIIPMDGDLQNDPSDIFPLLSKIEEGYDVVSGWRKFRKDNALKRNFPSRVANYMISKISGVHLHDYGCSLKAYRRDILDGIRLYGEMHRFIPIYASWMGARITEIPVKHHPRIHGVSKYGLERIVKVILDLIVVKFLARYATKPIYVFGGFGVLTLAVSFLSGLGAVYLKLFEGTSFILTPLPLLCVMALITGIMSILMGLLAEVIVRTYYESQGKKVYIVRNTVNL